MPYKLKQLTQEQVQIAINHMAANHSAKSVRNAHGLLSSVLTAYAPSFQLHTRLPQKEKSDTSIPTEAEVSALLKATEGEPIHTAILLAAVGTLRLSEICALLKSDVTDKGVIVNKAMVMDENKEWVIKGTKTTAGTRFVELPKYVIDELRAIEGDRIYKYQPGRSDETFLYFEKEGF